MSLQTRITALAEHIALLLKTISGNIPNPPVVYDFYYDSAPAPATSLGSGSWTCPIPAGARRADLILVGPGGPGASGRRGAAGTNRSGGAGGNSGGVTSDYGVVLGESEPDMQITVGAKGIGGAGQLTNDSNGNAGVRGTSTTLQIAGLLYTAASGAPGSGGGTTSAAASTDFYITAMYISERAGAGSSGAGVTPTWYSRYTQGGTGAGGGGGGVNASNVFGNGGGIDVTYFFKRNWSDPGIANTEGQDGPGAVLTSTDSFLLSPGGCGGAGNSVGEGGDGADAQGLGGGGGGGGASVNGFKSGDGGDGGPGGVRVIFYF